MTQWLHDRSPELWPGCSVSLEYTEVVEYCKSEYQEISVIQTTNNRRALVIDNHIQLTEFDEFSYHESLAHTAIQISDPSEVRVLIIGGGDLGVAREILKYPHVKHVLVVELDAKVVEMCSKYFQFTRDVLKDERVKVVYTDGIEFLRNYTGEKFNIIISDLSDPIENTPADQIFTESYIALVSECLSTDGVSVMQSESLWFHEKIIDRLYKGAIGHFKFVKFGNILVPTYPGGSIGLLVMSKSKDILNCAFHSKDILLGLKYYSEEIHRSQFVLPKFMADKFL
jgi:spermidine synthase